MRPKSEIYTPKRDAEHPLPFQLGDPLPPHPFYRAWSSFLLAFFHMRILSVILVSASRYATVIVNFRKFVRFIVFSPV